MARFLTDRVVIITGGSRGIGRATAIAAAARGFRVCVGYASNEAAASEVVAAIEASNGKAIAVKCDVGKRERHPGAVQGRRRVRHARRAGQQCRHRRAAPRGSTRCRPSASQRMMAVNVTGSMLCAREAVKRMSTRHGGKGGVIVNLSSVAAKLGSPNTYVDYAASKGAIDSFTDRARPRSRRRRHSRRRDPARA